MQKVDWKFIAEGDNLSRYVSVEFPKVFDLKDFNDEGYIDRESEGVNGEYIDYRSANELVAFGKSVYLSDLIIKFDSTLFEKETRKVYRPPRFGSDNDTLILETPWMIMKGALKFNKIMDGCFGNLTKVGVERTSAYVNFMSRFNHYLMEESSNVFKEETFVMFRFKTTV